MTGIKFLARRTFFTGILVGIGASVGWLFRRTQKPAPIPNKKNQELAKSAFEYDVSAFMKTDPDLLVFQPKAEFSLPFERVKSVLLGPQGEYLVAGDRSIKAFSDAGKPLYELSLSRPPHCMTLAENGMLWVGFAQHCEAYDLGSLERKLKTQSFGENAFLTSLQAYEDRIYVADAGNRDMAVIGAEKGEELFRFGKKTEENPGFNVPSPYFDFVIGRDLKLHVSNPGLLRVETYTLDGRFESSWGRPGMQPDAFCGCCNPVFLEQLPSGDFVTSEKGLSRLHLYTETGEFYGVVAGPEHLVEDEALAKKACGDCSKGSGFDVVSLPNGDVATLDPFKRSLRVFSPTDSALNT